MGVGHKPPQENTSLPAKWEGGGQGSRLTPGLPRSTLLQMWDLSNHMPHTFADVGPVQPAAHRHQSGRVGTGRAALRAPLRKAALSSGLQARRPQWKVRRKEAGRRGGRGGKQGDAIYVVEAAPPDCGQQQWRIVKGAANALLCLPQASFHHIGLISLCFATSLLPSPQHPLVQFYPP